MKIKYRTQNDGDQEYYSARTALDCSTEGNKDVTRQEFKDDADINTILSRFGVDNQQRTATQFGEADYTIDLQQALHSINDTQRAYARMDPEIRKIYPSYQKFVQGIMTGAVETDLARIKKEKEAPIPMPPEEKPK